MVTLIGADHVRHIPSVGTCRLQFTMGKKRTLIQDHQDLTHLSLTESTESQTKLRDRQNAAMMRDNDEKEVGVTRESEITPVSIRLVLSLSDFFECSVLSLFLSLPRCARLAAYTNSKAGDWHLQGS